MGRRHHLVLFLPPAEAFEAELDWRGPLGRVFPGLSEVSYTTAIADAADAEQRQAKLTEALRGAGARGFVLVDPPGSSAELAEIDSVCRALFGRRKRHLPKGIFFSPPPSRRGKEEPEALAQYRERLQPLHHYYRKDRRAFSFNRQKARAVRRALKLSRRSRSPIRWGLLAPTLGFVAVVLCIVFLLRDFLLRRGAVSGGQTVFGARVDVGGLGTDFEPSLRLSDVFVADRGEPLTNLFEFDSLVAGVDLLALLGGRVHVDEATLSGLELGTPRSESGALESPGEEDVVESEPSPFKQELTNRLGQVIEDLQRTFSPPELDELETVRVAREIEEETQLRLTRLREQGSADPWKAKIATARADLSALVDQPVPNSLQELRTGLTALQPPDVDIDGLRSRLTDAAGLGFQAERAQIDQAQQRVKSARTDIDAARNTLAKAQKLEKVDFTTIAQLPGLIKDVERTIGSVDSIKRRVVEARNLTESAASNITKIDANGLSQISTLRKAITDAKAKASDATGSASQLSSLRTVFDRARADVTERATTLQSAGQRLTDEVQSLQATIASVRTDLSADLEFVQNGPARLEAAAQADIAALKERYSLDSVDTDQIVATLVGEQVFGWLDKGRNLYRRLRPGNADGSPTKRESDSGTTFVFPPAQTDDGGTPGDAAPARPRVRIEHADFDGLFAVGSRTLELTGSATELSSNPALTGRDTEIEFSAGRDLESIVGALRWSPDHTLALELSADQLELDDVPFETRYAPEQLDSGRLGMRLAATFDGDSVRAHADVQLSELVLLAGNLAEDLGDTDPRVASLLTRLYTSFDSLDARIEVEAGASGIGALRVESDSLERVRDVMTESLRAEVADVSARAETELADRLAEPRAKAMAAVADFAPEAESLIGALGTEGTNASALLAAGQGDLQRTLTTQLALPDLPTDPAALGAAANAELAKLQQQLTGIEGRFTGDRDANRALLQTALADLGGLEGSTDDIETKLKAELQRLVRLR